MRKLLLTFSLVAIFVIAGLSAPSASAAQVTDNVQVRFVHALADGGSVDIYVNDNLVVPGADFGDATPHLRLPTGEHIITLRAAGSPATSAAIYSETINLTPQRPGLRETIIVQADANGSPLLSRNPDNLNPAQLGQARLHVIHAAADVGAVDLVGMNNAPIAQSVEYNTPFGTINPPVSFWELVMVPTGSTADNALVEIGPVSFNTGMLYTFILIGNNANPEVVSLATPLEADTNADTVLVAIGHGSSDAPAVDIYANDTKILVNLEPGAITPHIALPAGDIELAVRQAGDPPNSDAVQTTSLNLSSTTGAASLVALGSLADNSFAFSIYEDNVANLDTHMARVRVINTIANDPATVSLDSGLALASDLGSFAASNAVDLEAGTYNIQATAGALNLDLPMQNFNGGTYYTLLLFANASAGLNTSATALNLTADSLPGSQMGVAVAAATTEAAPPAATEDTSSASAATDSAPDAAAASGSTDSAPPPAAAATTQAAPPPAAGNPPPSTPPRQLDQIVRGTVNVNAGVNLQCREYPSSSAFSLGLIPNNTTLEVRGYAAPADPEIDTPFVPVEEGTFDEPTEAEDFEEIWLSAYWNTPDGGIIDCWVRADFLMMTYRTHLIDTPEKFFGLEELEVPIPVIRPIPYNYPGEAVDTTVAPPTPVESDPIATVNVNTGVNLHLRRLPDASSESLALIPNGTGLLVLERTPAMDELVDDGEDEDAEDEEADIPEEVWLFVEHTDEANTRITGWIAARYTILSQGGRTLELADIPIADPILPGEVVGVAAPASTQAPPAVSSEVIGTVNIAQGANLNMYDTPSTSGALLRSLGSGATVVVLGRTADSQWLNVRYEALGEGTWVGWVSNTGGWITLPVTVDTLPITG